MEERSCPDQILLGAMDPDFCVLLGLGCCLESRFSTYQQNAAGRRFLFGTADDDDEPQRINERCQVVREDGSAFANLFAGGGAACGVSGRGDSGYLSGNGLLSAVVLGRIAGRATPV